MTDEIVKPRFSFAGWQFKEWFLGNWNTIVEIFKVALPLLLSIEFVKDNLPLQTLITLAGKLVLDAIHYWLNQKD